jgi:transposase
MSKLSSDLSSVSCIGLDVANQLFQVHCVDGTGKVVLSQALKRKDLLAFFAGIT